MRDALQCLMKGSDAPELVTMKTLILRKKLKGYVYTHVFPKHYGVVHNKRGVLENFDMHPYGYVDAYKLIHMKPYGKHVEHSVNKSCHTLSKWFPHHDCRTYLQ